MKFGVIGEPCIDYIHRNGSGSKQLGGILYSAVSLAVISGMKDEIYPIMNLGDDEFDFISSFLGKFNNIRHDFIYRCLHNTRIVRLYYVSPAAEPVCGQSAGPGPGYGKTYDREESSTEPTLPLRFEQIKPALNIMDGLLINMVSGVDIELGTLEKIRDEFSGYIHMDLHNAVMKTFPDGKRERAPLKDWVRWCANCDSLQMNEAEIAVLTEEKLSEKETAEKIIAGSDVSSVAVTRGILGTGVYERNTNSPGEVIKTEIPAAETKIFRDSTGCGDVMASAFFYRTMINKKNSITENVKYASVMASKNAGLAGVEELGKLIG